MARTSVTTADLDREITQHEAVCAERYEMILFRIERLEKIMIGTAGALILGLTSVLVAVISNGGHL